MSLCENGSVSYMYAIKRVIYNISRIKIGAKIVYLISVSKLLLY